MGALLPPVMGSVVEHRVAGEVRRRLYVSGDTLTGTHLDEIHRRHPDIDLAVVHLGGTRVLFHTVTMDAGQGVDFLRARPAGAGAAGALRRLPGLPLAAAGLPDRAGTLRAAGPGSHAGARRDGGPRRSTGVEGFPGGGLRRLRKRPPPHDRGHRLGTGTPRDSRDHRLERGRRVSPAGRRPGGWHRHGGSTRGGPGAPAAARPHAGWCPGPAGPR